MLKLASQNVFKKYTDFLHKSHFINAGIKSGRGGQENLFRNSHIENKSAVEEKNYTATF